MGAYDNINFTFFKFLQRFLFLFGRFEAVYIIHGYRKIFQALTESFKMLERQDGGGHQYGRLFAVATAFEGCPYGDLRFSKTHVTAYQPVHRRWRFHILLYISGGLALIGRIFINKGSFQLGLHVIIRRMLKTLLGFSLGIQRNEIKGNFLNLRFGLFFQLVPGITTQFIYLGYASFLAGIL